MRQVGDWRNLEDFNIRNNELRALPSQMGRWARIQRILAGGNRVVELPKEVKGCPPNRLSEPPPRDSCGTMQIAERLVAGWNISSAPPIFEMKQRNPETIRLGKFETIGVSCSARMDLRSIAPSHRSSCGRALPLER